MLRAPGGGTPEGTADRKYTAYARERTCVDGQCQYTDEREVWVIVRDATVSTYYGVEVNGDLGVITAYCPVASREAQCPSWVDLAIGQTAPAPPSTAGPTGTAADPATGVTTDWSYAPLPAENPASARAAG